MGDKVYPTRKEAGEAFREALNKNLGAIMSGKEIMLGEYRGMQLSIMYNDFRKMPQACLKGEKAHYCDLNIETTTGNIIRLDNAINSIQKTIDDLTAKVETKKSELEQMKIDVEKPFEKEQELLSKYIQVSIYMKGKEVEVPIKTVLNGFKGKTVRIASMSKSLFRYYKSGYLFDFKKFTHYIRRIFLFVK